MKELILSMIMMSEEHVTVPDYLEMSSSVIDQMQNEKDPIRQFYKDLDLVEKKIKLYDDTLKILLSWNDGISRKLHENYSEKKFLILHGIDEGRMKTKNDEFTIFINNAKLLSFTFCEHLIYTPLNENGPSHQCLTC